MRYILFILLSLHFNCYSQTLSTETGYIDCSSTPILYTKIIGGHKPFKLTVDGITYNLNRTDSIKLAAGVYNAVLTDSLSTSKNITLTVDTLKYFLWISPKILGIDTNYIVNNSNKITVTTDYIPNIKYKWIIQKPTSIEYKTTTTNSIDIDMLKDISGNIRVGLSYSFKSCNTVYNNTKIKIKPTIIKDTAVSSDKKYVYNVYATDRYIINISYNNNTPHDSIVNNSKRLIFNLNENNSFKIFSIRDTVNNSTRLDISGSYIIIKENVIDSTLIFYEAFSPNNDGLNDYFEIGNYMINDTIKFIQGKLQVLDKNGFLLYDNPRYLNEWNGKNTKNEDIPDGVYFFVFAPYIETKSIKKYGAAVEIRR